MKKPNRGAKLSIQSLEDRSTPAVDVLTFHNDIASTGVNNQEVQLSPVNVKVGAFGKLYTTGVDGQVYAQPLVKTGVGIQAGPNTTAGAENTTQDVVFVATEHDSLYAIDSTVLGGGILWKRSFTDLTPAYIGSKAGTNINNPQNASSISTVPNGETGSADITPEVGITGTPVIDPATNTLYVVVKTKEHIGTNDHYTQRLHAIDITKGTDKVVPYLIGDTTNGNDNNTQIYSYGNGDGSVLDPYNNTGKNVVQFNALHEHERGALSLVNNEVYVEWASHGDNGPYHGWVAKWDVSQLPTQGFQLTGVFNTSPNSGLCGIWQGGGRLAFEADGSAFYFETGNGPGGHGNPTLNANQFPADGTYSEALVKVTADKSTTAKKQNMNGWGLQAVDYFIPHNQVDLDNADADFGSGAPLLLPDSAGITGHKHLMVAAGKQGAIYMIDRDNLGKFDPTNDNVLNSVPNGSGNNTPPVQLGGSLSTAAYFNGKIYWTSGYDNTANAYSINSNGTLTTTSSTSSTFGYLPGSESISANGTLSGISWVMDRNSNLIHAYDANSFATELWNSGQKAGGADNLGAVVKFAVPTVANGEVYVGTSNSLTVYGLTPPANAVPKAPVLTATTLSGSSINLTWVDSTKLPNNASGYTIEKSTDGTNFTLATTSPAGATSVSIGGLSRQTKYYFRIRGSNGLGDSLNSNIVNVTTSNQIALIDYSAGFSKATNLLSLNGSAAINSSKLELTTNALFQAGSAYFKNQVDITKFSTQFNLQLSAGADIADGMTFIIQGTGLTAVGGVGGGLGYGVDPSNANAPKIDKSVAIKFDLYSNNGEGTSSTGLYTNGTSPDVTGSVDLLASNIDLHSGHTFLVNMTYDGTKLTVIIKDSVTNATATQNYTIDIPATVGGSQAYVGFTGATGGLGVVQDVLNWTFAPSATQAPNAPQGLGATPANATAVSLKWSNKATNQAGFQLDRATDANFTQNLITQDLPVAPNYFLDTATGLAPGSTFYYRVRAINSAGTSANSNVASVTIPKAPAKPTNAQVVVAKTNEIDLTWTDNAGTAATNYKVFRAVNHGGFVQYATLPALHASPPSTYTWNDTTVTPGLFYEYHIQAVNSSGHNDFTGTNATAVCLPPTTPSAIAGSKVVHLIWDGSKGAASYNVYRGTQPGAEGTSPIATGIKFKFFNDLNVANGTTYYYRISAVNANTNNKPVITSESDLSTEFSATPSRLFHTHINFTTATGQPVSGYLMDTGLAYGSRLFGLNYGWNQDTSADARNRDNPASPDELHDSLVHMQKADNPNATWEIAVPNGIYNVHVLAGEANNIDSVYKMNVENVIAVDGTPTTSKHWLENTVTVKVTDGKLTLSSATGASNNKIDAIDIQQAALSYWTGFKGATGLTLNGSSAIRGQSLQLTDGTANQSGSVFKTTPVSIARFSSQFTFQLSNPGTSGGFAFVIQNNSANALGQAGSGTGNVGMNPNVAIAFDLSNTMSITDSSSAKQPATTNLTSAGIDLRSGHLFRAYLNYDGKKLTVSLYDTVTKKSANLSYSVNIPAVFAKNGAFVGFTAVTGATGTTQNIQTWTYSPLL